MQLYLQNTFQAIFTNWNENHSKLTMFALTSAFIEIWNTEWKQLLRYASRDSIISTPYHSFGRYMVYLKYVLCNFIKGIPHFELALNKILVKADCGLFVGGSSVDFTHICRLLSDKHLNLLPRKKIKKGNRR